MRKILIGDIHGDYDAFISLLDKVKFNKDNDKLIILGDFIDKGPKTVEILDYLVELKNYMKDNLVIIQGNHEYEFLYHGYNIFKRFILFRFGRKEAIESFRQHNKDIRAYDEFLNNNMVNYYEDDLFQACHSTVIKENIKENSTYTLVVNRLRTCANRYSGKLTITGHVALPRPVHFKGPVDGKELLQYEIEKELPAKGIICIDTKGGSKLTAMIIEDKKYILEYVDRTC